jgi:hypothetical protein
MPIRLEKGKVVEYPQGKSLQLTIEGAKRVMTSKERRKFEERPWTDGELRLVLKYWYSLGPVLIAGELERSVENIEKAAKKMGLRDMEELVARQVERMEKRLSKLKL